MRTLTLSESNQVSAAGVGAVLTGVIVGGAAGAGTGIYFIRALDWYFPAMPCGCTSKSNEDVPQSLLLTVFSATSFGFLGALIGTSIGAALGG